MMFDKLFGKKSKPEEAAKEDNDPMQLAVAALLVEAACADDKYEESEKAVIDKSLAAKFGLELIAAKELRAKGEIAQKDALDIQRFTRIAKAMDQAEKIAFIEELWEIVLTDGERDPFEDALIRRICGLIYVEDRESGEARKRVAAKLAEK